MEQHHPHSPQPLRATGHHLWGRVHRWGWAGLLALGLGSCHWAGAAIAPNPCSPLGGGAEPAAGNETLGGAGYRWRNVDIRGMGFVTGGVVHPLGQGDEPLVYVRTDVGGIYRWQGTGWRQLLDGVPGYDQIESLALDPQDPQLLYAAAAGAILRSGDRGQTWAVIPLTTPQGTPVFMDGNGPWRWAGERLVVDPRNGQVLYFGSRRDGLFRSTDGGTTWNPVATFPLTPEEGEFAFVLMDPYAPLGRDAQGRGVSPVYGAVMASGDGSAASGLFHSRDGGQTWIPLQGGPIGAWPQQGVVTATERLYVTYFGVEPGAGGAVWRYDRGQGQAVTPRAGRNGGANFSAIAAFPRRQEPDRDRLLVAEYPFSPQGLHRSDDGGQRWQSLPLVSPPVQWWPQWHLYTLTGGLAINPQRPTQAWLTTGFGVLGTDDLDQRPSHWCPQMENLEELVVFVLRAPPVPGGARLFSGVADAHGFRHQSLTAIPPRSYLEGEFGDTTGLDFSAGDGNLIVRVGSAPGGPDRTASQIPLGAYSADNGRTWQPFGQYPPGAVNGKVAVSATVQANGYPIIVWAPQGEAYPHRSLDGGATWEPVQGAPNRTTLQLWFPSQAIAADRVNGDWFYLYHYTERANQATLYRSVDGGRTWQPGARQLPDSYEHAVRAVPGQAGGVWLRVAGALLRSQDGGQTFSPVAQVSQVRDFTFGHPAPGRSHPTVFLAGQVNGVPGLFRSDDALSLPEGSTTATWINLASPTQALGNVHYLEGDLLRFGHVYVGTGGRGILHGIPPNPLGNPRPAQPRSRLPSPGVIKARTALVADFLLC